MEFETEADEPAALLKALAPKCGHATATKVFYGREDKSFLVVCQIDGITSSEHALPPGFIQTKGMSNGVERFHYDKKQARMDMDMETAK